MLKIGEAEHSARAALQTPTGSTSWFLSDLAVSGG